LLDPSKVAQAKIEILGDPDWLGQDVVSTTRYINENNKTISYSAQQVFIEIRVKEPVDYDHSDGLLILNEDILFWSYPASKREELKGKISYRVIKVTSTFKSGKFTQVLDCVITTFPNDPAPTGTPAGQALTNRTQSGTTGSATVTDPRIQNTSVSGRNNTPPNSTSPELTGNDDSIIRGVSGVNISDVIVAP
jgi:hypothetical protein